MVSSENREREAENHQTNDRTDVDVKVEACGVCGSDVHTISGGWGAQNFPLCVGHGKNRRQNHTAAAAELLLT